MMDGSIPGVLVLLFISSWVDNSIEINSVNSFAPLPLHQLLPL